MYTLRRSITTIALLAASLPLNARAQAAGDGFLFKAPKWNLTVRTGLAVPRAQSDVFTFTSELLTVDPGDFNSITVGGDAEFRITERTHLVFSIDKARRKQHSEFRDYIDNEDLPIQQTTRFSRLNLSLGVKQYLVRPGRSIGRFAWVPARIAPFIGAGAGAMRYDFQQYGDFINFVDMGVFASQFASQGWTSTLHGRGGIDYAFAPHVALTFQGRYDWSKGATLSRDFAGFDRIDLAGFSTTAGLSFRF